MSSAGWTRRPPWLAAPEAMDQRVRRWRQPEQWALEASSCRRHPGPPVGQSRLRRASSGPRSTSVPCCPGGPWLGRRPPRPPTPSRWASHSVSTSKAKPSTRSSLKIARAAARRNPFRPLWVSSNGSPSMPRIVRLKTRLATRRIIGPLMAAARTPIATGAKWSAPMIWSSSLGPYDTSASVKTISPPSAACIPVRTANPLPRLGWQDSTRTRASPAAMASAAFTVASVEPSSTTRTSTWPGSWDRCASSVCRVSGSRSASL